MYQTYTDNQEEGVVTHIMVGHHPHVFTLCLPDITAPDQISQPLYLYTASDQTLEMETAWERGYNQDTEANKAAQSVHTIKLLFDFTIRTYGTNLQGDLCVRPPPETWVSATYIKILHLLQQCPTGPGWHQPATKGRLQ